MRSLLYATTNDYKLHVANLALQDYSIKLENLDKNIQDIAEIQSDNQEEVAIDKAEKYFNLLGKPLIVMDFGFFLEGYGGFPGVYTKYVIDTIGLDGLVSLARNSKDRRAYTQRTIIYKDDAMTKVFSSRCSGSIILEARGDNGRDYDKVFLVGATGKTLAEMTDAEKIVESGDAWREFGKWFVQDK